MSRAIRFAPLAVVVLIVAALLWRTTHPAETAVRSRMIGRQVPVFALPASVAGKPGLGSNDLVGGQPKLLNIFASWCVPCIAEAPVLAQLNVRGVTIHGIAIRDKSQDVARFLAAHGDPYGHVGADDNSRVQMALGSSGVPESFVVDGRGIIRFQHVGPILERDVPTVLRALEQAR
jgi:cytochrome c biogenesis protein CcmG/thiol:disulfide interchange protein DsbE